MGKTDSRKRPSGIVRGARGDRNWTVLFIGSHSKTISFPYFKGALIAAAGLMLALVLLAAGFGYLYRSAAAEKNALKTELENLTQAVESLRNEKDILMARLVLTESRSAESQEPASATAPKPPPPAVVPAKPEPRPAPTAPPPSIDRSAGDYHTVAAGETLYAIGQMYGLSVQQLSRLNDMGAEDTIHPGQQLLVNPEMGSSDSAETQEPVTRPPPQPAPLAASSEDDLQAEIEKFIVFREPEANLLRVEYVIRNTGSKSRPLTGRTVAVLKNEKNDPPDWLPLPSVPLESGKPTGENGLSFSVYNFRTMRFKLTDMENAGRFESVAVYVFSATGKLLAEKEFPIPEGAASSN